MSNILPFKKPSQKDKNRGKIMCRSNLHKWAVDKEKVFDVKSGKLVTTYICTRCGKTKSRAH
ncbi:hypothetical protein M3P05_19205 [Sansalvadorimonas sp. 2012CJ34-2]|uniref:Uncharacterized protein n=1 Tax=Parendozoicomonas callyspongiae TaxID=2942213 RepID=A0ABT0PL07_9GAMM|nr:hypothetical protein [Sansalvadorimonas sp. 2012CJ34-2]